MAGEVSSYSISHMHAAVIDRVYETEIAYWTLYRAQHLASLGDACRTRQAATPGGAILPPPELIADLSDLPALPDGDDATLPSGPAAVVDCDEIDRGRLDCREIDYRERSDRLRELMGRRVACGRPLLAITAPTTRRPQVDLRSDAVMALSRNPRAGGIRDFAIMANNFLVEPNACCGGGRQESCETGEADETGHTVDEDYDWFGDLVEGYDLARQESARQVAASVIDAWRAVDAAAARLNSLPVKATGQQAARGRVAAEVALQLAIVRYAKARGSLLRERGVWFEEHYRVGKLWHRSDDRCLVGDYEPREGDIILTGVAHCRSFWALYRMGNTGPPWHSGVVVRRSNGSLAVLEAGGDEDENVTLKPLTSLLFDTWNWEDEPRVFVRRVRRPLPPQASIRLTRFAEHRVGLGFASSCRLAMFGLPLKPVPPTDPDQATWFCSEIVTTALQVAGLVDPAVGPQLVTPEDLYHGHGIDLDRCWEPPKPWTPTRHPPRRKTGVTTIF